MEKKDIRDTRNMTDLGMTLAMLRQRAKLTQRELAVLIGVSDISLQNWESSINKPKAGNLMKLIEVLLLQGIFTKGKEQEEVETLWDRAGLNLAFDHEWFRAILARSEQQMSSPITIFCCFAHEDEPLLEELEKQLSLLRRQGLIADWYDRCIVPGTDWKQAFDSRLLTASVILLLISPDFLASDYIYSIEMERVLELHKTGVARAVPIILRPVYLEEAPF